MKKLGAAFYTRKNVLTIARQLLGKIIVTEFNGERSSARIVEVEAYNGEVDKASHTFGGRRTARTEPMYGQGGQAYVYLCYGIHHLFNVVTNTSGIPHAVLIRGAEPLEGIEWMRKRRGGKVPDHHLARGPGNFTKALGIFSILSGTSLTEGDIAIFDDGKRYKASEIGVSARIGVDYAGVDALLPYRFFLLSNRSVS